MERIRVVGGARLAGEVSVTGAKNSVLKLMAAALLAEGRTTLTRVPRLLSISSTITLENPACAGSSFTAKATKTAMTAVTNGGMMNSIRQFPGSTIQVPMPQKVSAKPPRM